MLSLVTGASSGIGLQYATQLARDYHLSDSTLLRYRKKYLEWFSFYYNKELQSNVS